MRVQIQASKHLALFWQAWFEELQIMHQEDAVHWTPMGPGHAVPGALEIP